MTEKPPGRARELLLWTALAAAFSPVLVSLVWSRAGPSFSSSALLVPLLLAHLVASDRSLERRVAWAPLLVLAGVALETVGIVGFSWTIARLGLPVAALGLALWLGRPRPAAVALLFALVPPPVFLFEWTTPHAETAFARTGAALLAPVADLTPSGPLLRSGERAFELEAAQNGLHLAVLFAVLAWYRGCRRSASAPALFGRAALAAFVALPVQALAVTIALAIFAAGSANAARAWLAHGAWIVAAACFFTWVARSDRRSKRARAEREASRESPARSRPPARPRRDRDRR